MQGLRVCVQLMEQQLLQLQTFHKIQVWQTMQWQLGKFKLHRLIFLWTWTTCSEDLTFHKFAFSLYIYLSMHILISYTYFNELTLIYYIYLWVFVYFGSYFLFIILFVKPIILLHIFYNCYVILCCCFFSIYTAEHSNFANFVTRLGCISSIVSRLNTLLMNNSSINKNKHPIKQNFNAQICATMMLLWLKMWKKRTENETMTLTDQCHNDIWIQIL